MARWFHETFERITSLLPLYFDRVQAFSSAVYGFDVTPMHARTASMIAEDQDWNAEILQWLRDQEKTSGQEICVAMVLDAVQTNNLHVERGVQLAVRTMASKTNISKETLGEKAPESGLDNRTRWPAVYMRSTLRSAASSSLRSSQRSGTGSHGGSSTRLSGASQSNLLGWGLKGSASDINSENITGSIRGSPHVSSHKTNQSRIVEYGPDSGVATTWPHVEWDRLVGLIASNRAGPNRHDAISYHGEQGQAAQTWSARESIEEAPVVFASASSISSGDASTPSPSPGQSERKSASVFHIAHLSGSLSLVVIVKGFEARWHRRRTTLSDEEVRLFLTR